jgi:hypothetical protein
MAKSPPRKSGGVAEVEMMDKKGKATLERGSYR